MTAEQTAKLASYVRVLTRLQASTEVQGNAKLQAYLLKLVAGIGELNKIAGIQTQDTEGFTASRNGQLTDMSAAAMAVANAVAVHAEEHKLATLGHTVDVSPGDFSRLRIFHRPWLAQRIHDAALSVLPALADFSVTDATLADLQAKIATVQAGLGEPRVTIDEKKVATERMAAAFTKVDALLVQTDRLVYPLRITSPEFHALYRAARDVVVNPGGHSAAPNPPAAPAPATPAAAPAVNQLAA